MRTIAGTLRGCIAYSHVRRSNSAEPKGIVRLEQTRYGSRLAVSGLDRGPSSVSLTGPALSTQGQIARRRPLVTTARQTSQGLLRQIQVRWLVAGSLFQLPLRGMLPVGFGKHERLPVELETTNTLTAEISVSRYRYLHCGIDFAFFDQWKAMFRHKSVSVSRVTA